MEILKDYILCFFNHKRAKNIFSRTFFVTFCSVIIMLFTNIFSLYLGDTVSFSYSYDSSGDFHSVLGKVLDENFSVSGGKISLTCKYNSYASDPENFRDNSYEVIIDTSDKSTSFEDVMVTMKSGEEEISYEDYLLLSEDLKENYSVVITHTGRLLDTVGNITRYEDLLFTVDSVECNNLRLSYESGEISLKEYADSSYVLYGSYYYPEDVSDSDYYGDMPTMFSYYRSCLNNDNTDNDYLFIYEDGLEASFKSEFKQVSFLGTFKSGSSYDIAGNKESEIKRFIMESFEAGSDYRITSYSLIGFIVWFALIILFIIEAVIFRGVLRVINPDGTVYIVKLLNLQGAFSLVSSFISFILVILLSFFMYKISVILISPAVIFVTVVIRTVIFFVREKNFDDSVKEEI